MPSSHFNIFKSSTNFWWQCPYVIFAVLLSHNYFAMVWKMCCLSYGWFDETILRNCNYFVEFGWYFGCKEMWKIQSKGFNTSYLAIIFLELNIAWSTIYGFTWGYANISWEGASSFGSSRSIHMNNSLINSFFVSGEVYDNSNKNNKNNNNTNNYKYN